MMQWVQEVEPSVGAMVPLGQVGQVVPSFSAVLKVPVLHCLQPVALEVAAWTVPYQPLW